MLKGRPADLASRSLRVVVDLLALVGAASLLAAAVIHLHLWAGSYRHIPTVGPLFLFQGIFAIACAVAVAGFRRLGLMVLGAVFMVSTAAGLLLSHWIGLFGYKENLAVPYAGMSLVIEFAGAGVLVLTGLAMVAGSKSSPSPGRRPPS
jgi:hypothetical protein